MNKQFRSQRLAHGWTQAELAERVCAEVERITGQRSAVDAQAVSRIECGEIRWPRHATRRALMALLEVDTEAALGLYPKRTQRDAEREEATKRRAFLVGAGLAAPLIADEPPRRIGALDVDDMRQKFARLADLDSYLGGADTFRLYATELTRTERTLSRSSSTVKIRTRLTELASEQAQQAGWAAFDAGFTDTALRLFDYSRRAADEAGSAELAANAFVHISYVTGSSESARAAETACTAIASVAHPKARALLESRRAWSCAIAGDRDGADRALGIARDALESTDSAAPHWCAWIDHAELDIMTGRVWAVLHQPEKATAPLERALTAYPDHWARDKALYLTWLADAYLDAGNETRAITAIDQALTLAGRVASVRPLPRVREVAQRCATRGTGGVELARRAATARPPILAQL
ncbi:hypothetical protein [Nocardia sp. CA-120079]|uniref:helix-turn-helix domain-containing protein n=1 Tax=Nocardia sp. CA-120079 TaxID=3239974 RepID=UPI003D99265F